MKPKLTIGMATYNDYYGVHSTIQALRLYHAEAMKECEIVVVDNNPNSAHGADTKHYIQWISSKCRARYVPFTDAIGTSVPRNKVFELAEGEAVLCMDPHVMLAPRAVAQLIAFYEQRIAGFFITGSADHVSVGEDDLFSGPMIYDELASSSTRFNDQWRAQMWGTLDTDPRANPYSPQCLGIPVEIPGMGLGVFSCLKKAWLGFHPKARGFGGEEMYIHEKYRRAGRRCWCLPWLGWNHRFGKPNGVAYPLNVWNKVRNYVLELTELGIPLDRLHRHFVEGIDEAGHGIGEVKFPPPMDKAGWNMLVKDPSNPPEWPADQKNPGNPAHVVVPATRPDCSEEAKVAMSIPLQRLYESVRKASSEVNEHCDTLRALASGMDSVVHLDRQHGVSIVALLAGQPKHLTIIDQNIASQGIKTIADPSRAGDTTVEFLQMAEPVETIPVCDLLFINAIRNPMVYARFVRKAIIVHGTQSNPAATRTIDSFLASGQGWLLGGKAIHNNGLVLLVRDASIKLPEQPQATPIPIPVAQTPISTPPQALPTPTEGPGTELKKMLESIGIVPSSVCDCNMKMAAMNHMGVEGCKQNRETIVGWLKDGSARWGWTDHLKAGIKGILKGWAFKFSWTDPYRGLVDEAIRRAEAKMKEVS